MTRMHYTLCTPTKRKHITVLRDQGLLYRQIERATGIPYPTVRYNLIKCQELGSFYADRPGRGRPLEFTPHKAHANWSQSRWNKVVFSDESKFNLFGSDVHSAQLEETKREVEVLRAQVTKLTSPTPPHMTPRGRGFYSRGSYLPPYASREPSPQGQRQLDPQAPSFYPRRQSTPPPTLPAQRLSVPTTSSTPSTPSTPPSTRRRTCIRCGQPFSGTHQSMLQCLNPPLPPDEQGRQMNEYKTRTFLAGPPRTPGTPTPGSRPREVYSLDPAYDYAVQQGEGTGWNLAKVPKYHEMDRLVKLGGRKRSRTPPPGELILNFPSLSTQS
ncbi:hypothetical protein AURDEDRAFT_128121 [Auricularia subglabra TFB-10046 SS5]|nr:hypothetical protein AURDEDRAFT_128121 [Auricularia subglabra TFB-10046 SS5]